MRPPGRRHRRGADRQVGHQPQRVVGAEGRRQRAHLAAAVDRPARRAPVVVEDQARAVAAVDVRRDRLDLEALGGEEGQAAEPPVTPHEVGDELVGRVVEQVLRRADLRQVASDTEDRDPVAELDRLVDVVGHEGDGLAELGLQAQELLLQPVAHDGVDGAERLVHQHHRRVRRQGPGHADALLLASRELCGVAVRHRLVEAHPGEQLGGLLAGLLLVDPVEQGHRRDVVDDGAVREEAGRLDDVADAAPQQRRVLGRDVLAVDRDHARGRLDGAVDHPQAGGLAAAGGAHEHRDLTGGQLQRQVVDRDVAARESLCHLVERDHAALRRVGDSWSRGLKT